MMMMEIEPSNLLPHKAIPVYATIFILVDIAILTIQASMVYYSDLGALYFAYFVVHFITLCFKTAYYFECFNHDRISEHQWNFSVEYYPLVFCVLQLSCFHVFVLGLVLRQLGITMSMLWGAFTGQFIFCIALLCMAQVTIITITVCVVQHHRASGRLLLKSLKELATK